MTVRLRRRLPLRLGANLGRAAREPQHGALGAGRHSEGVHPLLVRVRARARVEVGVRAWVRVGVRARVRVRVWVRVRVRVSSW